MVPRPPLLTRNFNEKKNLIHSVSRSIWPQRKFQTGKQVPKELCSRSWPAGKSRSCGGCSLGTSTLRFAMPTPIEDSYSPISLTSLTRSHLAPPTRSCFEKQRQLLQPEDALVSLTDELDNCWVIAEWMARFPQGRLMLHWCWPRAIFGQSAYESAIRSTRCGNPSQYPKMMSSKQKTR